MNRKVAAVLGGTLLALGAATTWVPTVATGGRRSTGNILAGGSANVVVYKMRYPTRTGLYRWLWDPDLREEWVAGFPQGTLSPTRRIAWVGVLGTHVVILLLGGGLLTWVVRRERRRREEATV